MIELTRGVRKHNWTRSLINRVILTIDVRIRTHGEVLYIMIQFPLIFVNLWSADNLLLKVILASSGLLL